MGPTFCTNVRNIFSHRLRSWLTTPVGACRVVRVKKSWMRKPLYFFTPVFTCVPKIYTLNQDRMSRPQEDDIFKYENKITKTEGVGRGKISFFLP